MKIHHTCFNSSPASPISALKLRKDGESRGLERMISTHFFYFNVSFFIGNHSS
jgi:hypothetical protein